MTASEKWSARLIAMKTMDETNGVKSEMSVSLAQEIVADLIACEKERDDDNRNMPRLSRRSSGRSSGKRPKGGQDAQWDHLRDWCEEIKSQWRTALEQLVRELKVGHYRSYDWVAPRIEEILAMHSEEPGLREALEKIECIHGKR